ncbi:amino acid adenylation domain-containing protein [Streptomyces anandii]|uniref:amino acid adenylation domain-containing protein n=1 Tax=Streptomyces anandii TaxID=285454 RepID=UPI0036A2DF3E
MSGSNTDNRSWSATTTPPTREEAAAPLTAPVPPPVTELVERQAAEHPTRTALRRGELSWDYATLATTARRVASGLRGEGVEPGRVVAVHGGRGFETVAAVLGVMRARAVVLLLDAALPESRARDLLSAAAAELVVTTGDVPPLAPERTRPFAALAAAAETELPAVDAQDAAYVFFTSGTTGRPKGVLGWHGAVSHYVGWEQEAYGFGPADRVGQIAASLSFDAALRDFFLALTCGATLVLPDSDRPYEDPAGMLRWLDRQAVTIVHTVPSVLASWLNSEPRDTVLCASVRLLCLAGEPLPGALVRRWRERFPMFTGRVLNLYGTTEGTVLQSCHEVPEQVPDGILPVGAPIDDTQLLVLNRRGALCGVGEPGEVVVRTPFLTRGYLDGDGASGAFGTNPFGDDPADRVYRTGDLGRWTVDGTLAISGRVDDQVKIRGVRIQPVEVAAVLSGHPQVREATVIVRQIAQQAPQLHAYVVPVGAATPAWRQELRDLVAARLSTAAVPSRVIELAALPLSSNGKVDRGALPDVPEAHTEQAAPDRRPAGPAEQRLAALWAEILGVPVDSVARDTHFFELGGDSLSMVRVLSRVRGHFGADLGLQEFFRNPTVAELADLIGRTSDGPVAPRPVVGRRTGTGPLPLSHEQEGLWFLHQLDPAGFAYNMAGAFEIPADTELLRVEKALTELLSRHEALRTLFRADGGRPVQVVSDSIRPELRELPPAADRAAALAALAEEAARPFDLETGPLLRARLVRTPRELILGLVVHHIVCDGWSWQIIAADLDASLTASPAGQDVPLDGPAAPQYGDFAAWQRERTDEAALARSLEFWTERLRDAPELDLPADLPRPTARTHRGRIHRITVPAATAALLDRFCRAHGVTRYMALLAAFGLLLSRTAHQDEVVVGVDSAGRDQAELEQTVGFFVRTHAVRMGFAEAPRFSDAVRAVHGTLLASYEHQDLPFPRIVEALRPDRDGGRTPLFRTMFRMPPAEVPTRAMTALRPIDLEGTFATSKFDLTMVVRALDGDLVCDLEYDTDLFSEEFAAALAERYAELLSQGVRAPDVPEPRLAAGPAPVTTGSVPHPAPVLRELRERARTLPDAPAVRQGEQTWTYRQLVDAVDRIDAALPERAVVAVVGDKGFASVAALVAGMESGRVVVPVDAALPAARREQMTVRAGAQLAVVATAASLDAGLPVPTLRLSADGTPEDREQPLTAEPASAPDQAAYVFFTSGTTGEPKPVLGRRASLDHFVAWERDEFAIGPDDRVAQLTAFSFDAVLRDVFLPLSTGASVVLPPAGIQDDAQRLLTWLDEERVTVVHTTPSVLGSLLALGPEAAGAKLAALRLVCLAGEPLLDSTVTAFRSQFPDCRAELVNFYGPTETTMIRSFHRIPELPATGVQPVGRPLPDTRITVTGRGGRPCAPGERGEILIDTAFGTLGYLAPAEQPGRLAVTGEIRPDAPYRTGDIAVLRADGTIVPEGRRDGTVKLRGVRVHPSEIATAALTCPGVATCHVEAVSDDGQTRLVAFFTNRDGGRVTAETLRAHLVGRLPAPVVPALLLALPALPLMPNGKVDRRALLSYTGTAAATPHVAPRTATEKALARIWSDLLKKDEIGVETDFFETGGHSLLATVMITRVRKLLDSDLTLRQVLEQPTIARLAEAIDAGRQATTAERDGELVALSDAGPGRPLFCVHGIGGDVLAFRQLARLMADTGPVFAFRAQGTGPGERPRSDIRQIAAAYLYEMRQVQPTGPYRLAGWSVGGLIAYEMARQLSFDGERVELLALIDSYAPGARAYDGFDAEPAERAASFVAELAGTGFDGPAPDPAALAAAGPATQREADGTDIELRRRFSVYLAHSKAASKYRPAARPVEADRLLLLRALEQPRPEGTSPALGWEPFLGAPEESGQDAPVPGRLQVPAVPADHYSVLRQPAVETLARHLRTALAAAER